MAAGSTPMVLLHGGPGLWDYLGPVADLLEEFSTHRYDQRGCGRSGPVTEYRLDQYLSDLEELRRHHGHERWTVFGHSFGASLALTYASRYPDRVEAVIYCDGVGLDWPSHRATYHANAKARLTAQQQARLSELESTVRTWPQEVQWRALRWLPDFAPGDSAEPLAYAAAGIDLTVNSACNQALWPQVSERGLPAELAECAAVETPVLVIHGAADPRPLAPVAALAEALPQGRLAVLEGGGHQPWLEQPAAFASAIRHWSVSRMRGTPGPEKRPNEGPAGYERPVCGPPQVREDRGTPPARQGRETPSDREERSGNDRRHDRRDGDQRPAGRPGAPE